MGRRSASAILHGWPAVVNNRSCKSRTLVTLTPNEPPASGEADILSEGGRIVVDNTTSGFEFHRLDKLGNYLLYRTGPSREPALPRQVKFGEDGNVVVGGSDHSTVYVFDRKGGHTLELLRHRRNDMVQTVTVCHTILQEN